MKLAINHQLVEVDVPADTTVLQFLRENGLTGTKEGCASGDCGACTVIARSQRKGSLETRTFNACIAPIGQFAGCHLVTVEGLAADDDLHPAQSAMVNCHGSQCGFCTPGFVMSLAALVEQRVPADRETVLTGISGNLCRCTGYRPIVDAGLAALDSEPRLRDAALLDSLTAEGDTAVLRPVDEAALQQDMAAHPDAKLVAGGTDLLLEVTQQYKAIPVMIDLTGVAELCEVTATKSEVIIGAAVPYTRLESEPLLNSAPFDQLLLRLGSRQIRNRGTVGGNLANGSPIADIPPALIAWDADIEIVNSEGESRQVAVTDFYRGYRETVLAADEYIARIRVPRDSLAAFHRFYKSSKRIEDDISSAMGAFSIRGADGKIESARVAFGGMAATPVRLPEVEAALEGNAVDDALIESSCAMLRDLMTPLTDVRASADYRMAMAEAMLARALREFNGESCPLVTEVNLDA